MSSEPKPLSTEARTALSRIANAIILLGAALSVVVLVIALPRYHPFVGLDQLLTFYVLPALLTLALLATFRLSPETRIGLALFMVMTGITLMVVETALVFIGATSPTSGPEGGSPVFDKVAEFRSAGDPATPSVSGNTLLDRGLTVAIGSTDLRPITTGPANRTTVLCSEFIEPVSYTSDRYGFNNPDEVWDRDTIDVTLIGDSFTAGVCVNTEHQIASYLGESMTAVNLGVRGIGPLHELAILREYGSLRPTRDVVWIYYEGNDIWDLTGAEAGQPWLREYLDGDYEQGLVDHQVEIDRVYGAWLDSLVALGPDQAVEELGQLGPTAFGLLSSVPHLTALRQLIGFGVLVPRLGSALDEFPEILERARADVTRAGGEFHVVYLPTFGRFAMRFGEGIAGRAEFLRLMDSTGTSFLDLVPVFEATGHPKELWTNPRGHLSPEGYRVVADAIEELVSSPNG